MGGGDNVATREELLHAAQGLEVVVHHLGEEAGGEVQRRHLVLGEHGFQFLQVGRRVGREDDETRSVEQRAPELQGGGVEGDGGDEQERLVRAEVCVVDAEDGAQHGGVRSPDTLGPTGGAGGEVDVREALGQRGLRRRGRGLALQGHLSQHDGGEALGRQLREQLARGEEHRGAGVLQHGREALTWVRRVQRDVGAAGLEDGDEGDNQLQRALQGNGHARVGGHAQATQVVSELVGARVELPVGELRGSELAGELAGGRAGELDGDLVGEAGDHLREDLGEGGGARVLGGGGIPLHQHLPALRLGQQGEGVQRRVGPVDERLHQHAEVLRHPLRGGALEQVGVVPQHPLVALRRLSQIELQLEPGRGVVHLHLPQHQRRLPSRGPGCVLQGEEHLEERGAAEVPLQSQLLHQLLEGHVLVRVAAQCGLPHLGEQRPEAAPRGHPRAEHQGVDEEADEPFRLRVPAARDGRADQHVLLSGVARQQHLEGRQQHHEGCGPFPPCQLCQGLAQLPRQPHRHRAALLRQHRGPGLVGGQLQM